MKREKLILVCMSAAFFTAGVSFAQTTLSGNHVVDGDLTVGTGINKSTLMVNGETGANSSLALQVLGDGGVGFGGGFGVGQIPAIGGDSKFIWHAGKAALRAGYFPSISEVGIGQYSVAFGSGFAGGMGAFAAGMNPAAIGDGSVAIGDYSDAFGECSLAFGAFSAAFEPYSLAVGWTASALGYNACALGYGVVAQGNYSVALGYMTLAKGHASLALGEGTVASTSGSLAIGRYNIGGTGSAVPESEEPVFEIGNGSGIYADDRFDTLSNAFTVFRNGNVTVTGKVKMPRQGDIMMGEFGNPD